MQQPKELDVREEYSFVIILFMVEESKRSLCTSVI